jgi:hypothetical protein
LENLEFNGVNKIRGATHEDSIIKLATKIKLDFLTGKFQIMKKAQTQTASDESEKSMLLKVGWN